MTQRQAALLLFVSVVGKVATLDRQVMSNTAFDHTDLQFLTLNEYVVGPTDYSTSPSLNAVTLTRRGHQVVDTMLRTLGDAMFIVPDGWVPKRYFETNYLIPQALVATFDTQCESIQNKGGEALDDADYRFERDWREYRQSW